jgi:hypothetical protein
LTAHIDRNKTRSPPLPCAVSPFLREKNSILSSLGICAGSEGHSPRPLRLQ